MGWNFKKLLPYFLVITLSAGCVTQTETIEPPHPASQAEEQAKLDADKHIAFESDLRKFIRVTRIKAVPASPGFLKVQINVQNLTGAFQTFSYRMDWYEPNGTALPMASAEAQKWSLLPGETSFLAATAPTPSATDYKVTFFRDTPAGN